MSSPIVPGKKYTAQEMARLRALYPDLQMPGYVIRYDLDGTAAFIPWHEATGGGGTFGGSPDKAEREFSSEQAFGEIAPIRKRTPLERLDSLMQKVGPSLLGGQGMTAEQLSEFVDKTAGEAIKKGRRMPTGEDVRVVLQAFLREAEKKKTEHDSHFITTPTD